jgi:hypothetical protein
LVSVSSDEVVRVVGGDRVEVHSPEDVEIAARRSVHITSANLVDVKGGQFYLRAGDEGEESDDFPAGDISVAILADKTLRLKSANGALIACADKKLVLHSHHGSADLSAKGSVHIAGGTIVASAGHITAHSGHDVSITAEGVLEMVSKDALRIASDDILVQAINISIEGNGSIVIRAPNITLEGDTTIQGSLTVNGAVTTT